MGPSEDVTFPVGNGPSLEKVKLGTVGKAVVSIVAVLILELPVMGEFSSVVIVLLSTDEALDDGKTSVKRVSTEELGVGKISVMTVGVYVDFGPPELEDEVGNTSVIVVSTLVEDEVGKMSVLTVEYSGPSELGGEVGKISVMVVSMLDEEVENTSVKLLSIEELGVGKTSVTTVEDSGPSVADEDDGKASVLLVTKVELGVVNTSVNLVSDETPEDELTPPLEATAELDDFGG